MEIAHRITFGHNDNIDPIIEGMGVEYKTSPLPGKGYLIHVDITEANPLWPQMAILAQEKGALDIFDTVFTPKEILDADCVRLIPVFERGYPQPEGTWVARPVNYTEHCTLCGTFSQAQSFRLKKEPNLAGNDFMSLYWTYALFCTPRVLAELKAREFQGYEVWDAIIHRRNTRSEKVAQLFISDIAGAALVQVDDLERHTCPLCNVTKYSPHKRGVMYLKRGALPPDVDFINSYEWFGSGHSAYREIVVSKRVAKLVVEQGWQGVRMKAVKWV